MLKCVIFDFYGTLGTLAVDWKSTIKEIVNEYLAHGIPEEVFSNIPGVAGKLVKVYDYMILKFGKEKADNIHKKVSKIFEDHEVAGVKDAKLLLFAKHSLNTIRKNGLKIGLVTGQSKKSIDQTFKKFNLQGFFDSIVTRESPGRMKPHPDQINLCLKELGCKPEEAISIGDLDRDVIASRKAGVFAVGLRPNFEKWLRSQRDRRISDVIKNRYEPLVKNSDALVDDLKEFTELVLEMSE